MSCPQLEGQEVVKAARDTPGALSCLALHKSLHVCPSGGSCHCLHCTDEDTRHRKAKRASSGARRGHVSAVATVLSTRPRGLWPGSPLPPVACTPHLGLTA